MKLTTTIAATAVVLSTFGVTAATAAPICLRPVSSTGTTVTVCADAGVTPQAAPAGFTGVYSAGTAGASASASDADTGPITTVGPLTIHDPVSLQETGTGQTINVARTGAGVHNDSVNPGTWRYESFAIGGKTIRVPLPGFFYPEGDVDVAAAGANSRCDLPETGFSPTGDGVDDLLRSILGVPSCPVNAGALGDLIEFEGPGFSLSRVR